MYCKVSLQVVLQILACKHGCKLQDMTKTENVVSFICFPAIRFTLQESNIYRWSKSLIQLHIAIWNNNITINCLVLKFSVGTFVLYNSGTHFVEIPLLKKSYISTPSYFRYSASLLITLLVSDKLQNTETQDSDYSYKILKNNEINLNPDGNLNAILCESKSFRELAALKYLYSITVVQILLKSLHSKKIITILRRPILGIPRVSRLFCSYRKNYKTQKYNIPITCI